jgi:alpha-tubulin suppressor-like RCC1 family protein
MSRALLLPVVGLICAGCGFDDDLLIADSVPLPGTDAGSDAGVDAPQVPDAPFDSPSSPGLIFAVGEFSTCAVVRGTTYCWGAKSNVATTFEPNPSPVDLPEPLIQLSAGEAHGCGVSGAGRVYCWGDNAMAQLGSSDPATTGPLRVPLPARARSVACGAVHNCAILDDGTLWCWGSNEESRLGFPERTLDLIVPTPTQIGIANDYFLAAGGQGHSCALRGRGALWCWGRNTSAQLGLGSFNPGQATMPLRVGSDDDWAAITSAQEGSCGKKQDGRIFCWGNNGAGRVGAGPEYSVSPVAVGDDAYTSIATSPFHTCAVKTDRTLWCWGRNVEGQLATGNYDAVTGPTQAVGSGFVEVGVGRFHTCAADAAGNLFCAGKNDVGQLGLGDTERRAEMTRVPLGG